MHDGLKSAVEAAETQNTNMKKQKLQDSRKVTAARDKVLKDYTKHGLPVNFARYMFHVKWVKASDEEEDQKDAGLVKESGEPADASDDEPGSSYESNMTETTTAKFEVNKFAVFPPSAKGCAATLRELPASLTLERLAKAKTSVFQHMQKKQWYAGYIRLCPKGEPNDSYETWKWVPEFMRVAGHTPEAARTFGPPWILRNVPG